jgi:hypothetical protein
VVSAADGDRDVLDLERKTMLYDTNKALAAERDAFLSVWGWRFELEADTGDKGKANTARYEERVLES